MAEHLKAVKRVAIGRKNWLFAGHDAAGRTAALWDSFLASAERHKIDPQHYLASLLAQIPTTPPHPSEDGPICPRQ